MRCPIHRCLRPVAQPLKGYVAIAVPRLFDVLGRAVTPKGHRVEYQKNGITRGHLLHSEERLINLSNLPPHRQWLVG